MKIICEFGFYKFYPASINELVIFASVFGKNLVKMEDFYTFASLASLPDYSIEGQKFGGVTASVSFEGKPWEVFKQNALNYNLDADTIELANSKSKVIRESTESYNWVVTGLPQAFAQLSNKTQITGFEGFVDVSRNYTIINRWQNADI